MENSGLRGGVRLMPTGPGSGPLRAGSWGRVQNGAFFDGRLCNARRFAGPAYLLV